MAGGATAFLLCTRGGKYSCPAEGTRNRVIAIDPPASPTQPLVFWIRPNRSLSRRGMMALWGVLAGSSMLVALISGVAGNAYAALFALVESGALALALAAVWKAGARAERIRCAEDALEVHAFPSGEQRARFQPYWVRLGWKPGNGHRRLMLGSHGREIEIGAFLGDGEREQLHQRLELLLARAHQPARREHEPSGN